MTSDASVYKRVIDIIRMKPDLEVLFFEIAKEFPEAIVSAFEKLTGDYRSPKEMLKEMLDDDIMAMYHDIEKGGKIRAIKFTREKMMCGLKEAKDYVEALEKTREARTILEREG